MVKQVQAVGDQAKYSMFEKIKKKIMDKTGLHVLILEQDERVCRVLGRIIKQIGFEPLAMNEYSHFKTSYLEFKPDIILLSLDNPDVDHNKLLQDLVHQDTHMTIILLSNMDEDEIASFEKLCLVAGLNMGGILKKPIAVESVKFKLEELARKKHRQPLKKNHQFSQSFREWLAVVRKLNIRPELELAMRMD